MTSVDKAAVIWTMAIVVIGVSIALLGGQLQSSTAPAITPTMAIVQTTAALSTDVIKCSSN